MITLADVVHQTTWNAVQIFIVNSLTCAKIIGASRIQIARFTLLSHFVEH